MPISIKMDLLSKLVTVVLGDGLKGLSVPLIVHRKVLHKRMAQAYWLFFAFSMLIGSCLGQSKPTRIVTTKYGKVQGFLQIHSNKALKPVEVYLGIPYATPPILSNRF